VATICLAFHYDFEKALLQSKVDPRRFQGPPSKSCSTLTIAPPFRLIKTTPLPTIIPHFVLITTYLNLGKHRLAQVQGWGKL